MILFQMDNPAYQRDAEKGTELEMVRNKTNGSSGNDPSTSCKPEVCIVARQRYQAPDLSDSPWQTRKTVFLIGTIVLLVIWIIVYTTLSQLKLL